MEYFEEEVVKRVALDLGITMVNATVKDLEIERAHAAIKQLTERNEGLEARVLAYEADIDRLRKEIGAKPVPRRGK